MKLHTKINRISLIMAIILAVMLSIAVAYMIESYAEKQAREEGLVVVEMAKVGLLHTMQKAEKGPLVQIEVRKEIDDLFSSFASIPELLEMRSLRGEAVIRQFGKDNNEEFIEDVYLAIESASRKWTMPIHHWKTALNRFMIEFPDRMPEKF